MSFPGTTPTKFGRFKVEETTPPERLHTYTAGPLKTSDFEPPCPVLDQEDLFKQGIDTSQLVKGAPKVDALGSCTCNAGTVSLVERRATAKQVGVMMGTYPAGQNAIETEKFAILLYHSVTSTFNNDGPSAWPPTDGGSTGLYVCEELEKLQFIKGHQVPANLESLLSLLQKGTVIMGAPWFNAWMEPSPDGFVDGNGTEQDLQDALDSGVAGGHETCITAIERISPNVVLRVRNSWSSAWGDAGSYRIHLSTLRMLGSDVDFKQFTV